MIKPSIKLLLVILFPFPGQLYGDRVNLLETDWAIAREKAETEGRHLYVAFLGQGWSVASDRFHRVILESPEWKTLAAERLVYCPVLARRKPELTKDETAHLQAIVIHFDIKSYPTSILLAPDGTEILRHGYRDDSPVDYVQLLRAILPPPRTQRPSD